MKHDIASFLGDILAAIESIEKFLTGVDETTFANSDLIRAAVERKFIIIGEALSHIEKRDSSPDSKISEIQQIIGFRHRLVHGYRLIDARRVYSTAIESLPALKLSVTGLLNQSR